MCRFLKFGAVPLATLVVLAATASARAQDDDMSDYATPTEEEVSESVGERAPEQPESAAEIPPEDEPTPDFDEDGSEDDEEEEDEKKPGAVKKVHVGLRAGYGAPIGDIQDGVPLASDSSDPIPIGVSGMIPIQLDLGYLAFPNILLGLYVQYGIGFFSNCTRCSGSDIRFGIQFQYHFVPQGSFDPWLGIGVGYEFLSATEKDAEDGSDSSFSARGFEFANLQAGLDIALAESFTLGPFVSFSLGQFSNSTTKPPGEAEEKSSISDKALHMWLEPGLKGTLRF